MPALPAARGPLSSSVIDLLVGRRSLPFPAFASAVRRVPDPLREGDLQLALLLCYELHHHGLDGVPEDREWDPRVLRRRSLLERALEDALVRRVPVPEATGEPVWSDLQRLVDADDGPSVSSYLAKRAGQDEVRDFLVQRSVYHLREADSHTWAIPRLRGAAKAAMVTIQADEYGGGDAGRMHASLFAQTMVELGLDPTYGSHWDAASAQTLATVNVLSMFGLHRRLRGAACGHLAALEMTSTGPNRMYGRGLRRLGLGPAATAFFDEHVEADAVHEQIAAVDLCGALVADEPDQLPWVLWGAACCLTLDAAAGAELLDRWVARELPDVEASGVVA